MSKLEALLDRTYLSNPLPHSNRALATWCCLITSEDAQRNLFRRSAGQLSSASLIFYLDRFKYSMRYALARIAKETRDLSWPTLPRKIVGKLYTSASRLMLAGLDYSLAAQLCGALRTGTAVCRKEPDAWRVDIDERHHDRAYGALELMGIPKRSFINAGLYLYYWIRHPQQAPEVLEAIAASTVVQAELVNYGYRQDLAVALSQAMRQEPPLIPQDWVFPWSDLNSTCQLLNALLIRSTYHMAAVHFGALGHGLRGGGVSSLVLVLTVDELVDDLKLLSSVPRSHIQKFVHALTWGRATTNPDPALQPFIPLGNGHLAVPCIHVMTSDQERNLLSLQARIDSASFNSQSWRFERDMVASLLAQQHVDGIQSLTNVKLQVQQTEEEIDAVLIDRAARQLLMCELRWMLPPGDPREVQNRKAEVLKKIDQLARKVEGVARDPSTAVSQLLGPDSGATEGDWSVTGVVLIAGYGGTRSPSERFPIIPVTLFERALSRAGSLAELSASASLSVAGQRHAMGKECDNVLYHTLIEGLMGAAVTEKNRSSPSLDLNDPTEARLAGYARRISELLAAQAALANADVESSLDDFLGAVYGLIRAKHKKFRDRPGRRINIKPVAQRAARIGAGDLRTTGLWIAGFYFNDALFRTAAVYHRILQVAAAPHTGRNDVPTLQTAVIARYPGSGSIRSTARSTS